MYNYYQSSLSLIFSSTESPAGVSTHLLRYGNTIATDSPGLLQTSQKQRTEASAQEFDSTRYLYQLVVRCYECLSLWKLICEFQLHFTISRMSKVHACDCHVIAVWSAGYDWTGYKRTLETCHFSLSYFEWKRCKFQQSILVVICSELRVNWFEDLIWWRLNGLVEGLIWWFNLEAEWI